METIADYGSSDEDDEHMSSPQISLSSPAQPPQTTLQPHQQAQTHHGRVRTFPHVPGNFPVHVFIPVPVPNLAASPLTTLLNRVHHLFPDIQPMTANSSSISSPDVSSTAAASLVQQSYHVSLSHTAPIRLPQLDSLLTTLRNSLSQLHPFYLRVHPTLQVYLNDERTRTFLALKVTAAALFLPTRENSKVLSSSSSVVERDPLFHAIHAVSTAFEVHDLPRFYADPQFHISLGWLVGDHAAALKAAFLGGSEEEEDGGGGDSAVCAALKDLERSVVWEVAPEDVWCRVGQKEHTIWRWRR